jgi:hypothetical protein
MMVKRQETKRFRAVISNALPRFSPINTMRQTLRYSNLIPLLLILFFVPAAQAQERINRDAFYNSADGFHVLIPAGWENRSTENFAHFVQPDTGVNIYAAAAPTTDMQAGLDEVLGQIDPAFAGQPAQTTEVNLANGTWTQNIYALGEDASLTAYGQVYEGTTYVVVWYSTENGTQPVIVATAEDQDGITTALDALGYRPGDPASTDEMEIGEQIWTRSVFDGTAPLTVLARVGEQATQVIVKPGAPDDSDATLPVFFALLTGFFITPATTPYLYLGLAASGIIAVLFIAMLLLRYRSLRKDMETLEALEADNRATT